VAEKLKVVRSDRHDEAFQIIANREGLMGLAEICLRLAMLPENDEEAAKLGGHYHYAEWMNNAEPGSEPITIIYHASL
jgi:hypothetical protein